MLLERISDTAVGFEKWSVHTAVAEREVTSLAEMETMCAEPSEVRCVRFLLFLSGLDCRETERSVFSDDRNVE